MERKSICGVDAEVAHTFAERVKGLVGRSGLEPGKGLLIERCNCIHTFFMRFAIDATFLDGEGRVVKVGMRFSTETLAIEDWVVEG